MASNDECDSDQPCVEAKLLALHTVVMSLARTLAVTGVLDRAAFQQQLLQGRAWLEAHDHGPGHQTQAYDALLHMLKTV